MVVNLDVSPCVYTGLFQNQHWTFQIPVDPAQMQWFQAGITWATFPAQRVAITRTATLYDTVNNVYMVEVQVNNTSLNPGWCEFEILIAETQ